jgi:MFS superfamily sulfate permease-like transporter
MSGVFKSPYFGKDVVSSIVVFLVALPLCMGIAIASGVPPAAGLITGIIGGLVAGALSGAPLQVSGPAAGLTVLVWQLVQEHGIEALGVAVVLAGAIQITAGLLRCGPWFRAISPAVISGMLAGIGVLIFASQFHIMVDDQPRGSGIQNLLSIPQAIYKGIFPLDGSSHHIAAALGILTIAVILGWSRFAPQKLHMLPGPLVAAVVATAAAAIWRLPVKYVDVPESLLGAVNAPTLETFARFLNQNLIIEAVALAFIASAETLLSVTAVDQMHTGPRANYDRELTSQGVGNMLCGMLGALPMTGVIVRSSANVEAGARTRLSTILHGVWLLAAIVAAPALLRSIPTAALAAILVYTGYKLVNPAKVRMLANIGRSEVAIYFATLSGIVLTDLLTGVVLGLALAAGKLLYTFSHLVVDIERSEGRADIHLRGAATFLRLPKLAAAIESVPLKNEVHIHFEEVDYIDHACLELIANSQKLREKAGARFVFEYEELAQRLHRPASLAAGKNNNAAGKNNNLIASRSRDRQGAVSL